MVVTVTVTVTVVLRMVVGMTTLLRRGRVGGTGEALLDRTVVQPYPAGFGGRGNDGERQRGGRVHSECYNVTACDRQATSSPRRPLFEIGERDAIGPGV